MSLIKFYAILAICAAPLWCSSNPNDDNYIDPNTKTLRINGEMPLALLEKGVLVPITVRQPCTVDGTTENGEIVKIQATRDIFCGYVLNVCSTTDPRQTVALNFAENQPGEFELTLSNPQLNNSFYPEDPREILMKMYASQRTAVQLNSGSEFNCDCLLGTDFINADGAENMNLNPGIYVYEGKIDVAAKKFAVKHGTLLASPLAMEFVPSDNPFIKQFAINGRPFYREINGMPTCFNAALLEIIGDSNNLSVKASFVGALRKSALSVLLDPSIIPYADLQKFLEAQQVKAQSAAAINQ